MVTINIKMVQCQYQFGQANTAVSRRISWSVSFKEVYRQRNAYLEATSMGDNNVQRINIHDK